jgi:hypothetical protein
VTRASDLHWYELTFPRDLELDAVLAVLSSLSGVSHRTRLIFELSATADGVVHRIGVSASAVAVVAAELRAASGSVRLDDSPPPRRTATARLIWQVVPRAGAIRSEDPDTTAASLLSSLFPLRDDEWVRLRWMLRSTAKPGLGSDTHTMRDGQLRALRAKLVLAGLHGHGELAVGAGSRARTGQLLDRSSSVLRGLATPFGRLVADPPAVALLAYLSGQRGRYLSVRELAAVIGWPIGGPEHLPGVELGAARRLAPSRDLPAAGRIVGRSDFPGLSRPIALPLAAATRHTYLLGPTGTGKTSLITNLIVQDMQAGRGLAVVDTNGDLARSLLDLVPDDRLGDVVYLDPTDPHPVGLNPLSVAPGVSPDLVADQLVELFRRVWAAFWGPRSAQLFHLGLATLARQPGASLVDLSRIFTDPAFRARVVGRLDDPVGLGAGWAWFETVPERERLNMLGPVFNKVWALTARPAARGVLGQAEPRITLAEVMADQRILIVNLAKGVLGAETSRLLGALVVTGLWQAATRRASLAVDARPTFMAYLDELQDLLAVPVPFDEMLSQGRKYLEFRGLRR